MHDIKHTKPLNADQGVFQLLHDGKTVSKAFYDSFFQQVIEIVPALLPDINYTTEILCGAEFWESLEGHQPNMAGKCLASMVSQGLLPLKCSGKASDNARYYQLK